MSCFTLGWPKVCSLSFSPETVINWSTYNQLPNGGDYCWWPDAIYSTWSMTNPQFISYPHTQWKPWKHSKWTCCPTPLWNQQQYHHQLVAAVAVQLDRPSNSNGRRETASGTRYLFKQSVRSIAFVFLFNINTHDSIVQTFVYQVKCSLYF